jgi:hypothetical protein
MVVAPLLSRTSKQAVATLLFSALLAAESQVQGPSMGYFFDEASAAIRPVAGMPGSAHIGDPLELAAIRKAQVSAKNFAIGLSGDENRVAIVRLGDGSVAVLDAVRPAPDMLVLSPQGSAAALFYSSDRHVTVLGNLPDGSVTAEFDLETAPESLAVSDDGQWVAAASDSVQMIGADGARRSYSANAKAVTQFVPGSHDVLIASGDVSIVRESTGIQVIGSAEEISAIAATNSAARVMVASSSRSLVKIFDTASGESSELSCSCAPASLASLSADGVFRLTPLGEGPVWVLDLNIAPRIAFVPAVRRSHE